MNLDLDHDLLQLLPPYYREVSDYQQIALAEQAAFGVLEGAVRKVLANFFIQTADEATISLWENALHIAANPDTEALDYRRQRVLNRLSMQPPFTLTFLYRKLDAIIGSGKWACSVDYPNYTLSIRSSAENQLYFQELAALIQAIKPAHIVFVNVPLFTSGILIAETVRKQSYSYNYRLGAWALGTAPFRSANAETTVKKPEDSSVQPQLLSAVAEEAASLAASARINKTVPAQEIGSACESAYLNEGGTSYQLAGKRLTISSRFDYDAAHSYDATAFEILDSGGAGLFSAACFFPVGAQTEVEVRLDILEGADFAQTQDGGLIPVTPEYAAVKFLSAAFQEVLAAQLAEQVTAVRLNGNRDFSVKKTVSGTAVTVEYDISNTDNISQVRDIALLDVSGNTLTQVAVDLPITEPTTIRHTLNLKEGTLNYGR